MPQISEALWNLLPIPSVIFFENVTSPYRAGRGKRRLSHLCKSYSKFASAHRAEQSPAPTSCICFHRFLTQNECADLKLMIVRILGRFRGGA